MLGTFRGHPSVCMHIHNRTTMMIWSAINSSMLKLVFCFYFQISFGLVAQDKFVQFNTTKLLQLWLANFLFLYENQYYIKEMKKTIQNLVNQRSTNKRYSPQKQIQKQLLHCHTILQTILHELLNLINYRKWNIPKWRKRSP